MLQKHTFFQGPEGRFFRVLFFLRVSLQTERPGPQGGPSPGPGPGPHARAHGPMDPAPWALYMGPWALYLGVGPDWLWLWL